MYKIKKHSGANKRIKRLKSGLFKASHAGRRKLLIKKSAKRKQGLRKAFFLCSGDVRCMIQRISVNKL